MAGQVLNVDNVSKVEIPKLICNQQVGGSNPTAGSKITMGSVITLEPHSCIGTR